MNCGPHGSGRKALTLIEVLVVLLMIGLLAVIVLPMYHGPDRAPLPQCMYNLKESALAFGNWAMDHGNNFPMQTSTNRGGSREYNSGSVAFRHFALLAPYLSASDDPTRLLVCPVDHRKPAASLATLDNGHLSYFVNLDASLTFPGSILAGDRFLTNDAPGESNVLTLTATNCLRWTGGHASRTDRFRGCVGFTDGHVEFPKPSDLQITLTNLQARTIRLLVP